MRTPGGCTPTGRGAWTPGTPASTDSPWGEIIGGAGSGAPASSKARLSCPAHGADEAHGAQHGAMANHSLQVRPLELAYTSCRVPGMVPPSTNHGNAGAGTKGGSICAKNCNGCLICSGAQRTGWLLHPPLFSPHEAGALSMGSRRT